MFLKKYIVSKSRFFDFENYFYTARDDKNNTVFFISKSNNKDFDEHLLMFNN